ncbi:hypothetical protein O1611_g5340 [Lasiodiplodia mahajangana]|uniref:Uncharacterized protein n=1 Tax=Lasiodiplodia mahajangana TaxID=1108764 RepID=A0ACC2JLM3_9PEZI|nr:hypothetical protein O1611_g5340 [Lasiodiplodia mahajangana]
MLDPSPALDFESEKAIILGLRCGLRAVSRTRENILNFPLQIPLPDRPIAILETTGCYEFSPLPQPTFQKLYNTHLESERYTRDCFVAPSDGGFLSEDQILTGWAEPVTDACRELTVVKDDLWMRNNERIDCAGYTLYPNFESEHLLQEGERGTSDPPCPLWYAESFFESTSGQHGCILVTYAEEHLEPKQILRSELLSLLALLEGAGLCALKEGTSAMSPSVFVLSFTPTQVRALEARVKSPDQITISIRPVLNQVPVGPERDDKFRELVAWAMYTDAAVVPRPASSMSKWSATTSNKDNTDDEKDGVMTGNTSFTEENEKEEKELLEQAS